MNVRNNPPNGQEMRNGRKKRTSLLPLFTPPSKDYPWKPSIQMRTLENQDAPQWKTFTNKNSFH